MDRCSFLRVGAVKRTKVTAKFPDVLLSVILFLSVIFIASAYLILHHETRRHVNMIKTQQLPQDAVDRFVKESKAPLKDDGLRNWCCYGLFYTNGLLIVGISFELAGHYPFTVDPHLLLATKGIEEICTQNARRGRASR